jgi:hypothetical protein
LTSDRADVIQDELCLLFDLVSFGSEHASLPGISISVSKSDFADVTEASVKNGVQCERVPSRLDIELAL